MSAHLLPCTIIALSIVTMRSPASADGPKPSQHFGAVVKAQTPAVLAEVLAAADKFNGKVVTVEGKVRANCTRRGCWMELATSLDAAAPGCRVTFKDYGFFIPLDSKGATARVEGQVTVKVVSKEEVEHLEHEGGAFPHKLPDGSAREVRLIASGVDLAR